MNILIVEDGDSLRGSLTKHFQNAGHVVDSAKDLSSARQIWRLKSDSFDLVVLDINLPDGSGLDFLRLTRQPEAEVGVLVLTARSQVSDKVHLLDLGADDYMTKPFEFPELDARVRSIQRRRLKKPVGLDRLPPFEYDAAQVTFWHQGEQVPLRLKEAQLLSALAQAANHQCTKAQLIDRLYSAEQAVTDNALEVHIARLRQKLKPYGASIKAVRGVGYRYDYID